MSPTLATYIAARLFPHRWWFLGESLLGMALLLAALTHAPTGAATVATALAGPIVFVPWALLCACVWLHPERGNLQPGSRLIGRLPHVIQRFVRWYASLFLGLFIFAALFVWPALSLLWL